jgi:aminoglycoside 6'-N-acetyltransferase I
MKLVSIDRKEFYAWEEMRKDLYHVLNNDSHLQEMENIFQSKVWYCQFIKDENNRIIGLVELSSRNIVDGCLSSPVAYLEGLYLKPEHRGKGKGKEVIKTILNWCKEKGFSELATDTELTNIEAQSFYKAVGFQETDRVVEYRIEVNQT